MASRVALWWRRRSSWWRLWRFTTSLATLATGAQIAAAENTAARQQFALEIPSVSVEDVEKNVSLRSGRHAYVIKGYFNSKWRAGAWSLDYLNQKIPFEWVEYYPENMAKEKHKLRRHNFSHALGKFRKPADDSRVMQVRLSFRGLKRLSKDFVEKPLPEVLWADDEWINDCMVDGGKPDEKAIDNFFTTNQWRLLVIGETGSEVYFHRGDLPTATWHAQLAGRKKWTLCPNAEALSLSAEINTFKPDEAVEKFPKFAQAFCGQVTTEPGDLLFYPAFMWHHTYDLDTPSIAYTGALVGVEGERRDLSAGSNVNRRLYTELMNKCDKCWTSVTKTQDGKPVDKDKSRCEDLSTRGTGLAPPPQRVVCQSYLYKCYLLWEEHTKLLGEPYESKAGSRKDPKQEGKEEL